jgi:hypothetical protein
LLIQEHRARPTSFQLIESDDRPMAMDEEHTYQQDAVGIQIQL